VPAPARQKFFCWGYLVAGPNWRASLGTAFLIAAPTGVFLALVAPYLTREVHAIIMVFRYVGQRFHACIETTRGSVRFHTGRMGELASKPMPVRLCCRSCLLPTLSMIFLFMTACRDPGIIPRQEPDEEYLSGRKPRCARRPSPFVESSPVWVQLGQRAGLSDASTEQLLLHTVVCIRRGPGVRVRTQLGWTLQPGLAPPWALHG
jgi:hypothetical protein